MTIDIDDARTFNRERLALAAQETVTEAELWAMLDIAGALLERYRCAGIPPMARLDPRRR